MLLTLQKPRKNSSDDAKVTPRVPRQSDPKRLKSDSKLGPESLLSQF